MKLIALLCLIAAAIAHAETTNIEATITSQTVTNVIEGNNATGCATCAMLAPASANGMSLALYHPWHNAPPYKAADEKWTITNVVQRWREKILTHTDDTVISSTTNRWRLRSEWANEK